MATLNELQIQAQALLGGDLVPLGYEQLTSFSSAKALQSVPAGAKVVVLNPETKSVRWRDDGTSPTTSVGMVIAAGEYFTYTGDPSALVFIEVSATAKLNVSYYGGP